MKNVYTIPCLVASLFIAAPAFPVAEGMPGFEENRGQVRNMDGGAATQVRYRMVQGDTRIFLLERGMAFQFNRTHFPEGFAEAMKRAETDPHEEVAFRALLSQVREESFRMDMILEGADPDAVISASGPSSDYVNYYRYDALDVHRYERITYHEVYPGIDWVVYTTAEGVKYDFVVHPCADPAQIRLTFAHHEELGLDDQGRLVHGNPMGRFIEERPVSFQDGREVSTVFVLEGSTLYFALGDYDANLPLTIDPARIWGTYYGDNANDYGRATIMDNSGNVYLAGYSGSVDNIAAGGHQMTLGGDLDAILVKFMPDGTRIWATYYGGALSDYGRGVATDSNGNVYLAGYGSSGGLALNGHQGTLGGSNDAFLAKFNSAGALLWATYYGGAEADVGRGCAVDASDNVYLAGYTRSTAAIASGGHQNLQGGNGEYDAFLVKFNSAGVRQWGTYYGGPGWDGGDACAVDGNDVYLVGYSEGGDIASGGHQNTLAGARDAFLVKFNSNGVRQWATYFGGEAEEEGQDVAVDPMGNVIISGYSVSSTGVATSGAHQTGYGGGARDAMLAKFNAEGELQWATYFGGSDYDSGWTCAVDASGNIALGGTTTSSSGIALNGHQMTIGGSDDDAFLAMFDPSGVQLWGTYYGYVIEDDAYGSVFDAMGNVYLAGTTRSILNIAQDGHQNQYGGGFYDGFLVKFEGSSVGLTNTTSVADGLQWLGQEGSMHHIQLGGTAPERIMLYDAAGHLLMHASNARSGRILMDLGGRAPGVYVLRTDQDAVRLVHR